MNNASLHKSAGLKEKAMAQSLDTPALTKYVARQISHVLPDSAVDAGVLSPFVKKAMARVEYCFSRIRDKYYFNGSQVLFNHLNTDQYAMFLYYLSNTIWEEAGDDVLAAKVYYLNKALHGLDAFYEVKLPEVFRLVHPVGVVLGRGQYSNYFVAFQRVTIGGNMNFEYPLLGENVIMYGNSAIIGKCRIGKGCVMSFGAAIIDEDVSAGTVIIGKNNGVQKKKARKNHIEHFFYM